MHASDRCHRPVIMPTQSGQPFDHVAGGDERPLYSVLLRDRDAQYPALSRVESLMCTSCIYCSRRFRFALDYFYHFVLMQPCREKVMKEEVGTRSLSNMMYLLLQCSLS